jgi:16S rRNA processing protein RimM
MADVDRSEPEHLVVGHVTKPHGTKGELFVWPLTDHSLEVFAPGKEVLVADEEGRRDRDYETPFVIEDARPFKRGLLVKFEGLDDRAAVEELAQRYLLAATTELEPLEEDEVFYHQLLGLEVVTTDGNIVGKIREVYETAPAHLLEVKSEQGKIHLIPFSERIVESVDVQGGRMVIQLIPGLLDL